MDLSALHTELTTDPLTVGYAGMTPTQVVASLDAVNITVPINPLVVSGSVIFNNIVPGEFRALGAASQQSVRDVFDLGAAIDVSAGTQTRSILLANFASGTTTHSNFVNLAITQVSRAFQINCLGVTVNDVIAVRGF